MLLSCQSYVDCFKEVGQSWDGDYFRKVLLLTENVIPFLKDPDSVVFLHDHAPCMSSLATQALLAEHNIDFLETLNGQVIHQTSTKLEIWEQL